MSRKELSVSIRRDIDPVKWLEEDPSRADDLADMVERLKEEDGINRQMTLLVLGVGLLSNQIRPEELTIHATYGKGATTGREN